MKLCSKCNTFKPLDKFHKHKTTKDGYGTHCKECFNAATKEKKHMARYGLTSKQVEELKKNGCELCGSKEALHVDHNHVTGKVRGCLCTNCNRGLGHFMDSPDLLAKAIDYLKTKGNYSKWNNK